MNNVVCLQDVRDQRVEEAIRAQMYVNRINAAIDSLINARGETIPGCEKALALLQYLRNDYLFGSP